MGKVITEAEAMANRAPKVKPDGKAKRGTSPTNNSNGSSDLPQAPGKRRSGRTTPSENSKTSGSSGGQKKGVSFSKQDSTSGASNNNKKKTSKSTKAVRVGTRSKGGTTEMLLLPDEFPKKKAKPKMKKIKKGDNVTVVKMLTGTLYMYRGNKPRAEFIRSK